MMMGSWWMVFVILTLFIGVFIILFDGFSVTKKEESPLSILDKRYASGEIDDEEYIRKKNLLKK